ncbi:hypothetical protein DFH28DRAFT_1133179 [Melampsora americana]|nr:hypothetical protein DFH28DRAFT_1133179 [Melampsora americana]
MGLVVKAGLDALGMKPHWICHSGLGRFPPVAVMAVINEEDNLHQDKDPAGPYLDSEDNDDDDVDSNHSGDLTETDSDADDDQDLDDIEQEDKPANYQNRKKEYLLGDTYMKQLTKDMDMVNKKLMLSSAHRADFNQRRDQANAQYESDGSRQLKALLSGHGIRWGIQAKRWEQMWEAHELIQEMQSLPTNTQGYLLNSFLRDCQFAQGIASSAITPSQLQSSYPGQIPPQANVYEQREEHLTSFTPTPTRLSHDTQTDLAPTTFHLESIDSGNKEPPIDPTLDQATLAMLKSGDTKSYSSPLPNFDIIKHLQNPHVQPLITPALKPAVELGSIEQPVEPAAELGSIEPPVEPEVKVTSAQKSPQPRNTKKAKRSQPTPSHADPKPVPPDAASKPQVRKRKVPPSPDRAAKPQGRKRKGPTPDPALKPQSRPRKLPKGWVELDPSEAPLGANVKEPITERENCQNCKAGPTLPPKVTTRRQAAAAKQEPGLVPSATSSTNHLPSPRPDTTSQTKHKAKKLAKKNVKQVEEENEIEAAILKKWPFMDDLPQYILPFIKNATNVPKDGLRAFSAVAVSLGQTPDQAPTVRTALLNHLHSRYEWYADNMPKFAVNFDLKRIELILGSTSLTASIEDWFPMPMGGYLIANTYHRPLIYYSGSDANSKLMLPCFDSLNDQYQPIVMGYIEDSHYISLELEWKYNLPVPFVHPDWLEVCDPRAANWYTKYEKHITVFLDLKWQREWIANRDGTFTRRPPVEIDDEEDDLEVSSESDFREAMLKTENGNTDQL